MTTNKQQMTDIPPALLDAASEWIVKLSNDAATEADHQSFALWLSKSPEHKAAYDQTANLWFDLGCVRYIEADSSHTLEDQPNAGEGRPIVTTSKSSSLWTKLAEKRNFVASFALCALATMLFVSIEQAEPLSERSYATAVGEQQSTTLSDGSTIHLNTNTRLSVQYSDEQRLLTLSQGEAFFDVNKDPARPFVVQIPGGSVTAVGTAFNIEIDPQRTLVTVTEGVIRVQERNNSALPAQQLLARQSDGVAVHPVKGLERTDESDLEDVTAWRQQNLIFQNASLAQVVAELNRYSDRKIKIADASLAYEEINGVFKLDKPLETLQAIQTTLRLESKSQGQIILLYRG